MVDFVSDMIIWGDIWPNFDQARTRMADFWLILAAVANLDQVRPTIGDLGRIGRVVGQCVSQVLRDGQR